MGLSLQSRSPSASIFSGWRQVPERTDEALLVKRLSVNPATRRLAILSDNDTYSSRGDCDPAGVNVIGRVIWVGRRLV